MEINKINKKIVIAFTFLVLIVISSILFINNDNKVNASGTEKLEFWFEINGKRIVSKDDVISSIRHDFNSSFSETVDLLDIDLKVKSKVQSDVLLTAIEFDFTLNEYLVKIDGVESSRLIYENEKSPYRWKVPSGDLKNTIYFQWIGVGNLDKQNEKVTSDGVFLGRITFEVDKTKIPENFYIKPVIELNGNPSDIGDLGYNDPISGDVLQYFNDDFIFLPLQVGDPNAGPSTELKSLKINGEEELYEKSIDYILETSFITISYQDSIKGLTILFDKKSSTAVVNTFIRRDEIEKPFSIENTGRLKNNDTILFKITDGDEVERVYTRTINVTPPQTKTTLNITTNKQSLGVTIDDPVKENGDTKIIVNVPYSITDIIITGNLISSEFTTLDKTNYNITGLDTGLSQAYVFIVTAEDGETKETYNVYIKKSIGDNDTSFVLTVSDNSNLTVVDKIDSSYEYTLDEKKSNANLIFSDFKVTTKLYYLLGDSSSYDEKNYSLLPKDKKIIGTEINKGSFLEYTILAVSEDGTKELSKITIKRSESTVLEIDGIGITEKGYSVVDAQKEGLIYTYVIKDNNSATTDVNIKLKPGEYQSVIVMRDDNEIPSAQTFQINNSTLNTGDNLYKVIITSQSGKKLEYTLNIKKLSSENNITNINLLNNVSSAPIASGLDKFTLEGTDTYVYEMEYSVANSIKIVIQSSEKSKINSTENSTISLTHNFNLTTIDIYTSSIITIVAENGAIAQYTIKIIRKAADTNNSLDSIMINNVLLPGFSSTKTDGYDLQIFAHGTLTIDLYGTLDSLSQKATIEYFNKGVSQGTTTTFNLQGKTILPLEIRVTAESGAVKSYKINVIAASQENEILSITLDGIDQSLFKFEKNVYNYVFDVPYTIASTKVSAIASDYATIVGTGDKVFNQGKKTTIIVYAVSEAGINSDNKYTIEITRQAARTTNNLDTLSIAPNDTSVENIVGLDTKNTFEFKFTRSITNVRIKATIAGNNGETIVGTVGNYYEKLENLVQGLNTFTIRVKAENGTEKTYTIKITIADDDASFDSVTVGTTLYTNTNFTSKVLTIPNVPYSIKDLAFKLTKSNPYSTVTYTGDLNAAFDKWTLKDGLNTITFTITSEDKSKVESFTINITREVPNKANGLEKLQVLVTYTDGTIDLLDGVFGTLVKSYNIRVDRTIQSVKLVASVLESDRSTVIDGFSKDSTQAGIVTYSRLLNITKIGDLNTYVVKVQAEDTLTAANEYVLNIYSKNADNEISNVKIEYNGNLLYNGAFLSNALGEVPFNVIEFDVTITRKDIHSKVYINNILQTSNLLEFTVKIKIELGTGKNIIIKSDTDVSQTEIAKDYKTQTENFSYNKKAPSDVAELDTLVVTVNGVDLLLGTFDPATKSYKLRVDRKFNGVAISATAKENGTITGDTGSFTLVNGSTRTFILTVTSESLKKAEYSVIIENKNDDNEILDILVEGKTIGFNKDTLTYTVSDPFIYSTKTVNVTATLKDSFAKFTVSGNINLIPGAQTITVFATSEFGTNGSNYTISIIIDKPFEDINLKDLVVKDQNALVLEYDHAEKTYVKGRYNYVITLPEDSNTKEISIYPELLSFKQSISTNGSLENIVLIEIDGKINQKIEFTLNAENNKTQVYTITIVKAIVLSNDNSVLSVELRDNFTVSNLISFDPLIENYTLAVDFKVESLSLTVKTKDQKATLNIINPPKLVVGVNTITFQVTSESGIAGKLYTVTVTRGSASLDDTLAEIIINSNNGYILGLGDKTPVQIFDPLTNTYTIKLNETYKTYNITTKTNNESQQVVVSVTTNLDNPLVHGKTNITVIVTPQDINAPKRQYNIVLDRINSDVELDSISVDGKEIDLVNGPNFKVNVDSDKNNVLIDAKPSEGGKIEITDKFGNKYPTGSVPVDFGDNEYTIKVISEDGSKELEYKVTITKNAKKTDAELSEIIINSNNGYILGLGDKTPLMTYNPITKTYEITLDETYKTYNIITHKAYKEQEVLVSVPTNLDNVLSHGKTTITVIVTPEDANAAKVKYTIVLNRVNSDVTVNEIKVDGKEIDLSNGPLFKLPNLPSNKESINVDVSVSEGGKVVIKDKDGNLYPNGNFPIKDGINEIIIEIESEDGSTKKEYTIEVEKEKASDDVSLSSLTLKDQNGKFLIGNSKDNPNQEFDPSITHYEILLDRTNKFVDLQYKTNNPNAISSGDRGKISLVPGQSNLIKFSIMSELGSIENYLINIIVKNSDIEITDLSVLGFIIDYKQDTFEYDLGIVGSDVNYIDIKAVISDRFGKLSGDGRVRLYDGANFFNVTATSEDLSNSVTYTILVYKTPQSGGGIDLNKDNTLYDILIEGTKDEYLMDFDVDKLEYEIILKYKEEQIYLNPIIDSFAKATGTGFHKIEAGKSKTIIIRVTAQNGDLSDKIYQVTIFRELPETNNILDEFYILENGIRKDLDVLKTFQEVTVDPTTNEITIIAEGPKNSLVTGDGIKVLQSNGDIYTVLVTSEDGKQNLYTIKVNKQSNDATLDSLTVTNPSDNSEIEYSPVFENNIYTYNIDLTDKKDVTSINIFATTTTIVKSVDGLGTFTLKSGSGMTTDRFVIKVTAEDETTILTYEIIITRNIDPEDSIILDDLTLYGNSKLYLGMNNNLNPENLFVSSTKDYVINVPYMLNSVVLGANSKNGANITNLGNHDLIEKETIIKFKITSKSGRVQSEEYQIKIVKEDPSSNNTLDYIKINNVLINGFDPTIFEYEIILDVLKVLQINLTAKASDSKAVITGNIGELVINPGTNVFNITVKAEDGTVKNYKVTVKALSYDNDLYSLSVKDFEITPIFDKDITVYRTTVPYNVNHIEILATAHQNSKVNGVGIKINLEEGINRFTVYATSESGQAGKRYTIEVTRTYASNDTTLKNLEVRDKANNVLEFTGEFNPNTRNYIIYLAEDSNIMSVYINYVKSVDTQTVYGAGNQLLEGIIDGNYHTILKVTVEAENGDLEDYTIGIYRGIKLDDIAEIEAITVRGSDNVIYFNTDDFDKDIYEYKYLVPYNVSNLTLEIKAVGNAYGVGTKVFGSLNEITFEFYVVSQSGSHETSKYKIIFNREIPKTNGLLSNLTIDNTQVPNFDKNIFTYTINRPSVSSDEIIIDASAEDSSAVITGIGTKNLVSGTNTFTINVRSENGNIVSYTIIINYVDSNALLENLFIRGSNLDKYEDENSKEYSNIEFNPGIFEYTIVVDKDTRFVRITGAAQDQNGAQVTGFGTYKIGNNDEKIRIYVQSADGFETQIYIVIITKNYIPSDNSQLKSLTVGGYSLVFDKSNYYYNLSVGNKTNTLKLSAETFNPNAKIYIDGNIQQVASSEISVSLDNIKSGQNVILIKVVAEDNVSTSYYQLVVTRDVEPDMLLTILLILSLLLWIITILVIIFKRNRNKNDDRDELIF